MDTKLKAMESHPGRKPISPEEILNGYIYYKIINYIIEGNQKRQKVTLAWLTKRNIPHEKDPTKYYKKSWILKALKRLIGAGFVTIGKNGGYEVTSLLKATNARMDFQARMGQDFDKPVGHSIYLWGDIVDSTTFKEEIRSSLEELEMRLTAEWTRFVFEGIERELRRIIRDKDDEYTYEELAYIASHAGERVKYLIEQLGWTTDFMEGIGLKGTVDRIVLNSGLELVNTKDKIARISMILKSGTTPDQEAIKRLEFEVLDKVFRRTRPAESPLLVIPVQIPYDEDARKRMLKYMSVSRNQGNRERARILRPT